MKARTVKFIAYGARWFDKTAGNTYNSVRIVRLKDNAVLCVPFGYGYGEHYRDRALEAMAAAKWLPVEYRGENTRLYERDNNYPIAWSVTDGLKRDCIANGYKA